MEQLLTTKLFIPLTRPELVPRPRLIDKLNYGLHRKLTLVSAPAGFGKTTLVTEWLKDMRLDLKNEIHGENHIAWFSLDQTDNDPTRFLAYIIAALNQYEESDVAFGRGALSMLQSPQPPPIDAILTTLINEITNIPGKIILILDDYHLIDAQQIHDGVSFLLENIPPQMHLVIATREDPPLPLSRLRVRDQLTELRAADLRFTSVEAAEFLNQVMGLALSAEDITALETRTEGWIAGLQLAAISLQGYADTSRSIQSFTGSHRLVLDYLIEEVLNQQSQNIQNFLLHTAILDRLAGPLCDALTGLEDGQQTLEYLEQANLFIVPLDNGRRWYRYHHLFADLLHQRLNQTQPEQVPVLHCRASEWYKQNGLEDEAIEHALQAGDFNWAANLIEENADALWQRGEHHELRRWLEGIPDELILTKIQLSIFRAYYLFASGQLDAGEKYLRKAEKVLDFSNDCSIEASSQESDHIPDLEKLKLRGRIAVFRAMTSSDQGDVPGIIQHASKALEELPQEDSTWRSLAAIALGDAYSYMGDMTESYEARFEAVKACEAAGDTYYTILANLKLVSTLRAQGRLQQASEVCRQQVQHADEYGLSQTVTIGCILGTWGEALAELNDLEEARHYAEKGSKLTADGGNMAAYSHASLCQVRVLFSNGELDGAEEIINRIENTAHEFNLPPWASNQMAVWQARIWLERDNLDAASQWAQERDLDTDVGHKAALQMDYYLLFEYIMLARVLIAQRRLDETARLLDWLLEIAETGGRISAAIEILILQTFAVQAVGDTTQAMLKLEKALALAEPGGFIRVFVDEGPPMAQLLYEALSREIAPDYVPQLLAAFPTAEPKRLASSQKQLPESELIEPLSERELEVIQLIAEGLTNPEIASTLYLSLNTVKVHNRNIYGKLGVNNRTLAVSRARNLGIITSE